MSISQVEFERIDVNPWQTRLADDAEHIARLADDIAANGLLQTPIGRQHPTDPGRVQIAFGHSRLAALKLLVETKRRTDKRMPVDVHPLTDLQMSNFAASENAQRKNLSAIETATAIQRRIADFKLSQMEAAKPFGYTSQGGVSNLLRLLKLPEHTRELVHTGAVPERIARLLLPVARMSQADADKIADSVAKVDPSDRDERAADEVEKFLNKQGRGLNWRTPFKLEWPPKPMLVPAEVAKGVGGAPAEIPACKGCEFKLDVGRDASFCTRPPCWEVKRRMHFGHELRCASERLGIAIAGPDEKTSIVYDGSSYDYTMLKCAAKLVSSKADILRLALLPDKELERSGSDQLGHVTGSRVVMLLATNKAEADRIMATFSGQKARELAQANESEAEKTKRIEREDKLREENRKERSKNNRTKRDIVWLIETSSAWLARQIDATGGALMFMDDLVEHQFNCALDSLLSPINEQIEEAIEKAKGKEREALLRRRIALNVLQHDVTDIYGHDPYHDWALALDHVEASVEEHFHGKLPKDWNKPPIHKTATNCWTCGRFGSNPERITKGELEQGWQVQLKGKEVAGVLCPDHAITK